MRAELRHAVVTGVVAAVAAVAPVWPGGAAASPEARRPSIALRSLLERAGDQLQAYYERLQSVICTETVVQYELRSDLTPRGRPREFVYDVRIVPDVRADGASVTFVAERALLAVDGRQARPGHEPRCLDPRSTYDDPLAFLLPENRGRYLFSEPRRIHADGRPVDLVEFTVADPAVPTVDWQDTCFTISADGRRQSRVWFDASSGDVARLDLNLSAPVSFSAPRNLLSRLNGPARITLERSDVSIHYEPFAFEDPDEIVRLPASIVTLTVIDGARVPRLRTSQTFTDYRRFEVDARIVGVRD